MTANVWEYGWLTTPFASEVVVMLGRETTFSDNVSEVAVCAGGPESVTVNVREAVATAVGVPSINPEEWKVKPAGRVPEANCQE